MFKSIVKMKFIFVLIIFCIFAVTLTGCSSKYDYVHAPDRVEIYNSAAEDSTWMDCSKYSTKQADYYFENSLKDRQKDSFVDTAEQVLNDYPTDKVKFVVGTSFNTAYVGKAHNAKKTVHDTVETFYFHIDDLSSLNILVELNAKRYGEKTPYGLLYAYSYGQSVASKYNLPKTVSNGKLTEIINNNKDITDLNAFVFLSSFTNDTEKCAAKTLSIKLYEKIGLNKLQKILEHDNIEERQNILDFYIKSLCFENNITPQIKIGIDGFDCYHTQKYVVAENANLNVRFFITTDFKPLSYDTHLSNYSDLKDHLYEAVISLKK